MASAGKSGGCSRPIPSQAIRDGYRNYFSAMPIRCIDPAMRAAVLFGAPAGATLEKSPGCHPGNQRNPHRTLARVERFPPVMLPWFFCSGGGTGRAAQSAFSVHPCRGFARFLPTDPGWRPGLRSNVAPAGATGMIAQHPHHASLDQPRELVLDGLGIRASRGQNLFRGFGHVHPPSAS